MSQEDASVGATIASCYFLVNIYYVCFALITAILNLKLTVEYAVKFGNSPMVHELHRAQVIFISLALVSLIWDCIWPPMVFDTKPKQHRSGRVAVMVAGCLLLILSAAGVVGVTLCLIRGVPVWDGCKNYTKADPFKEMILRMAKANVKDGEVSEEAEHLCETFVRADWITLVRSAERLCNGFVAICGVSQVKAVKIFQKCLAKVFTGIFSIIYWVLRVLLYPLWICCCFIPHTIRFRKQWRKKKMERKAMVDIETAIRPGSIPIAGPLVRFESQTIEHSRNCPVPNSQFEALFSRRPIFLAILRNSHVQTTLNLIAVSKFINWQFTSLRRTSGAKGFLLSTSCEPGAKFECTSCSIPVCNGCCEERPPISAITTLHLQICEPRCSKCSFKKMRDREVGLNGCAHLRAQNKETEPWKVCVKCKELPERELVRLQEGRDLREMKHLRKGDVQCGECARTLSPSKLRWWACAQCGSECSSQYHWAQ